MMKEFATSNRSRRSLLAKAAAVAVLVVAVAGAAVAATGGIGRLLHWTGTVETHDGKVYQVEDGNVFDDEGNVIGTVEVEFAAE